MRVEHRLVAYMMAMHGPRPFVARDECGATSGVGFARAMDPEAYTHAIAPAGRPLNLVHRRGPFSARPDRETSFVELARLNPLTVKLDPIYEEAGDSKWPVDQSVTVRSVLRKAGRDAL